MHLEIDANAYTYVNDDGSRKTYHSFAVYAMGESPEDSHFFLITRWGKDGTIGQFKLQKFPHSHELKGADAGVIQQRTKKDYSRDASLIKITEPSSSTPTMESAISILLSQIRRGFDKENADVGVFNGRRLRYEILDGISKDFRDRWNADDADTQVDLNAEFKAIFEPEQEQKVERPNTWGAW